MRAAVLLSVIALAACSAAGGAESAPSHSVGERARSFDVKDFDQIELLASPHVIVRTGSAASVRAEGDPEALEKLDIRVEKNRLRIGYKKDRGLHFSRDSEVTIYVTAPRITGTSVAGSGDIQLDKAEADTFTASISGSGNLAIDRLAARNADFSIAGSGNIKASGTAADLAMNVMGSGTVDARTLKSETASISIAGSGDALAEVSKSAKIDIMGSGSATLTGSARCSVNKMGSGSARCGGA